MKSKLIILRGNSGSGKTTIAKQLQQYLQPRFVKDSGHGVMLVQQDVVRREMLRVKDTPGNPAIKLIEEMVLFGEKAGYDIILEGILNKDKYGDMLIQLATHFKGRVQAYYLDISFEETLRRHITKPNSHEYGEAEMKEWWQEKDYLNISNEKIISEDMPLEEILALVLKDFRSLGHKTIPEHDL